MPAGHSYTMRLKWKAAKATGGTIFAGAGPIGGSFSPTRLTLQLFSSSPAFESITTQETNHGSNGVTWVPIPHMAPVTFTPPAASTVVLGGNADLWTDTAGFNQDIGIQLSGGSFGSGQLIAWKESGGLAGTFSPNAAFVQGTASVAGGVLYSAQLVWKTNRLAPSNATIFAGAGPLPSTTSFSPTSLVAQLVPAGPNPFSAVITTQPSLTNSDGSTWSNLGVQVTVAPAVSVSAIIGANADLWTAQVGFNQDLAVFVSDNGGPDQLLVWKESGGFGGTFSPNAAFAETVFYMLGGHTYVFKLKWKTNHSASGTGATIFAGAGPIGALFSPTGLVVDEVN